MEKPKFFSAYLGFAFLAAFVYSLAAFYFIKQERYADTWVLYFGNFLFMAIIVGFLFYTSSKMEAPTKTLTLIKAGSITTVIGVIFAVLLSLVLLLIMIHGLLGKGVPSRVMTGRPSNTVQDRTNGLDFMVVINSVIGNFVTGAFVSLIFPASLYRNKSSKQNSLNE